MLSGTSNRTYSINGFDEFVNQEISLASVRSISISPIITPATRSDFEQYAKNNVDLLKGNLSVLGPIVNGGISHKVNGVISPYPANASNAFFVPISQISPIASNQASVMYDLYSDPIFTSTIDRALQTKRPAMTDIIQLPQVHFNVHSHNWMRLCVWCLHIPNYQ